MCTPGALPAGTTATVTCFQHACLAASAKDAKEYAEASAEAQQPRPQHIECCSMTVHTIQVRLQCKQECLLIPLHPEGLCVCMTTVVCQACCRQSSRWACRQAIPPAFFSAHSQSPICEQETEALQAAGLALLAHCCRAAPCVPQDESPAASLGLLTELLQFGGPHVQRCALSAAAAVTAGLPPHLLPAAELTPALLTVLDDQVCSCTTSRAFPTGAFTCTCAFTCILMA